MRTSAAADDQDLPKMDIPSQPSPLQARILEFAHILVHDFNGRILFWNTGAEQMYGWSRAEALGRCSHELLQTRFPGTRREIIDVTQQEGTWHGELVHVHRSGRRISVASHWVLDKGQNLAAPTIIEINNDITEQKAVESELRNLTRQLRRSNEELEQFVFAAGHDLAQPLRTIVSYLQLVIRRHSERMDEEVNALLRLAIQAGSRMQDLLNDLLEYGRAVGAESPLLAPVELATALEAALANLDGEIGAAKAEIRRGELPAVLAQTHDVVQLFQNLASNGIRYRASDRALILEIAAERKDNEIIVSVADNGVGIDAQYKDRIFGLFKRLHGPEIPGSGVGLAICKRIIERYGGKIWMESTPGRGSTFFFSLPAG